VTAAEVATQTVGLMFGICGGWWTVQLIIGGMRWAGRAGQGRT
jgi:hypothetical protein